MTVQLLVLADALGAALLAAWLYARFPSRTPGNATAILHAAVLFLVMGLIPRAASAVAGHDDVAIRKLASNFLVVLPALTYFWLVSVWLMLVAMRGARARY